MQREFIENIHTYIHQWYSYKDTHTLTCCGAQQVCVCVCSTSVIFPTQLSSHGRQQQMVQMIHLSFIKSYLFYLFHWAGVHTASLTSAFRWIYQLLNIPNMRQGKRFNVFFTFHSKMFPLTNVWKWTEVLILPLPTNRHPKVPWGVPGRGSIRQHFRVPGWWRRRGDEQLLVGALHFQCSGSSGSRFLLQQVRCLQLSEWH